MSEQMNPDFEQLFIAAPSPFVLLDRDLRMVWANEAYLQATDRSRDSIIGRIMTEEFPSDPESDSGRMLRGSFRRVFDSGITDHLPLIPYPIPGADGVLQMRYWSATHTPIRGSDGKVQYILQNTHDVTGLYEANPTVPASPQLQADVMRRADLVTRQNLELDSAAEFFRMVFDQAPSFMAILTGPDHRFRIVNDAYMQVVGERTLIGRTVREALPDLEGQGFFELLDQVYRSGQPIAFKGAEILLRRDEAEPEEQAFLDFVYQPLADAEGNTMGIFVQGHDVTAQKIAETNLKEAEERFRTMAHTMPVHVWTALPDGTMEWSSDQLHRYTGLDEEEIAGDGWLDTVHPEDRERVVGLWQRALEIAEGYETEFRIRRADGAWRWHLVRATPARDGRGAVVRWIGTNSDIDEQKVLSQQLADLNATLEARVEHRNRELEEVHARLRQSQRMEAIGGLAGGVAHDFNNLLQAMTGSLTMAVRELPADSPGRGRIEAAMRAVERGAGLSSQLLAFSRRQPLQPRPLDVRSLLNDIDTIMRSALGEAVELEIEAPQDLWPAFVDAASTENALLNLAMNARDAMEGRGSFRISMRNRTLTKADAAANPELSPGDYVEIRAEDDGAGMSASTLERVFEPFFTTKPIGKGTGLGLSTVYGFVRQSGGHVTIESTPGTGTAVTLALPRSARAAEKVRSHYAGTTPGGDELLLLVEDDRDVRESSAAILQDLGYTVRTAEDPEAALDVVREEPELDMVISDVVMPGDMSSRDMAEAMLAQRPDLPILFISGYSRDVIVRDGQVDEGVRFLSKPFSRAALAVKVRETLDARQTGTGAAGPADAGADAAHSLPGRGVASPILVCEDEALIRLDTVSMLTDLGAEVGEASTGAQALGMLEKTDYAILLVDVGLPDISGEEVARRARELRPGIGVIFATGRHEVAAAEEMSRCDVLRKPFSDRDLARAVEGLSELSREPG